MSPLLPHVRTFIWTPRPLTLWEKSGALSPSSSNNQEPWKQIWCFLQRKTFHQPWRRWPGHQIVVPSHHELLHKNSPKTVSNTQKLLYKLHTAKRQSPHPERKAGLCCRVKDSSCLPRAGLWRMWWVHIVCFSFSHHLVPFLDLGEVHDLSFLFLFLFLSFLYFLFLGNIHTNHCNLLAIHPCCTGPGSNRNTTKASNRNTEIPVFGLK